jgi:hypothetical protein
MITNAKLLKTFFVLLLAALGPLAGLAEELGDPAPPLVVKEWIKGSPVEIKPGTNIFVVVIWGTKGSDTRAAITNLNEIQKKYKDQGVIVIGICDESAQRIRNFVEQPDVHIDFAIGADTARRTTIAYMTGFKLRAIPRAFIVGKDARFLWHGSPLRGLNEVLGELVSGKYDFELAKKADAFRVQIEFYRNMVRRGDPGARAAGQSLIAAWTNDVRHLCDFAYVIIADTRNPGRDLKLAGQALDLAEKLAPTNTLRLLSTRAAFLVETGRPEQAIGMVKDAIAAAKDPKEKAALEPYLKGLEARVKARAATKTKTEGTNGVASASGSNAVTTTSATDGSATNSDGAKPRDPAAEKTHKSAP